MPTYDYVCEKCHHEFEVFQSMKDPHLKKCVLPKCGGKVRRKLGIGAGFVFKGSGFYITDYRSESYKAGAKSDSAASAPAAAANSDSGGSKTSSGTDSAPKKESSSAKGKGSSKKAG